MNDNITKEISIIVPVFNKWDLTRACLKSLLQTGISADAEILVIDNASCDETPVKLIEEFPNVMYFRQEVNLGFARACNLGALRAQGQYLIFLNNDTVVLPGWSEALLELVKTHPEAGVVGAKLLYPTYKIQHAGIVFNRKKDLLHIYSGLHENSPHVNKTRRFQAVTGACMLICRSLFLDMGGFDEIFQNGYEDIDLCLRLAQRGYEIWYQPESCIIHHESQTSGRHLNDGANLEKFNTRWRKKIYSDEENYYREDGFGPEIYPILKRFTSGKAPSNFIPTRWQISPDTSPETLKLLNQTAEELCLYGVDWRFKEVESKFKGVIGTVRPEFPAMALKVYLCKEGEESEGRLEGIAEKWSLKYHPDTKETIQLLVRDLKGKVLRHYVGTPSLVFKFLAASLDLPCNSPQKLLSCGRKLLKKDHKTAYIFSSEFIQAFPDDVEPYMLMGDLKRRNGDFEEAEKLYKTAYQIDSGHPGVITKLATLLLRKGYTTEARYYSERLLKIKPFSLTALSLLLKVRIRKSFQKCL
ncbi:MAG: glycosyltransferase [bacterium]